MVFFGSYTHLGLEDAQNEMIRMEEVGQARKEVDKLIGKNAEAIGIEFPAF